MTLVAQKLRPSHIIIKIIAAENEKCEHLLFCSGYGRQDAGPGIKAQWAV